MNKKLIGLILFFFMFQLIPMYPARANDSDFVVSNGVLTQYLGTGVDIIIPDNLGITTIGAYAFNSVSTSLRSVSIPNNVIYLDNASFSGCVNLTSVTIGNSVKSIGNSAFYYCTSLTNLVLPDSVTDIGEYAFQYCGLTSVTIGKSVKIIGDNAFRGCGLLTSVTIPSSVTSIGNLTFNYCTNLTQIYVDPNSNTYSSTDGILYDKTKTFLICCPAGKHEQSFNIPNSVRIIGNSAFSFSHSLTSITIPYSVEIIGSYAFERCNSLTNITIPDSVTSIGPGAFYRCSSLTSINIPNSVANIYEDTFNGCTNLMSLTISNNVKSIGDFAFMGCTSLTSVTIPSSVISIGYKVFFNCNQLNSINLNPTKAPKIDSMAFWTVPSTACLFIPYGAIGYNVIPWTLFKQYQMGSTQDNPRADFKYGLSAPEVGVTPRAVIFDATDTFDPNCDYKWTIIDHDSNGLTKQVELSGPLIAYKFAYSDNPYSVTLTVTNSSGESTIKKEDILVPKPIVVFVPGTMGSELSLKGTSVNHKIWFNSNKFLEDLTPIPGLGQVSPDSSLRYIFDGTFLLYDNGTTIQNIIPTGYIDENDHTSSGEVYDQFIKGLRNTGNFRVEIFSYDWRLDIDSNAEELNKKINQLILPTTPLQQVDIIAHSQGGLVAKAYLYKYKKEGKVDKYISIAVPQLGTVDAFVPWRTGNLIDFFKKDEGVFSMPIFKVKETMKNGPAFYEMFPSSLFFKFYGGYYKEISDYTGETKTTYFENYDVMHQWLLSNSTGYTNAKLVDLSDELHSKIDNFDVTQQNEFDGYEIVGQGLPTPSEVVSSNDIESLSFISKIKGGDGTVLTFSGSNGRTTTSSKTFYVNLNNMYNTEEQPKPVVHKNITTSAEVRALVLNILNSNPEDNLPDNKIRHTPWTDPYGFLIKVDCPVDLIVKDSNGLEVSEQNPNMGKSRFWNISKEAKSAFVQDNKFEAMLKGTDNGLTNLTIEQYDNGNVIKKYVFDNVTTTASSIAKVEGENNIGNLQLDLNGDGTFEQTISPDFVTEGDLFNDNTPPVLDAICSDGKFNNNGVAINVNATDESGIAKIIYSVNGEPYQTITGSVINFTNEGTYNVKIIAKDKAGNSSIPQVISFTIDKTGPTISGATTTAPNSSGWYKSDATVHFTATDALSGIDTITPDTVVSTEGVNQSITGTAVDKAGNSSTATVDGINIDKTAPVIDVQGIKDGDAYILNQKVISSWTVNDALSGVDNITATLPNALDIDTSVPGSHQYTIKATDKAGNVSEKVITYDVKYDYSGVLQPISISGTSVFKLGSTIPVKFTLKDANMNYIGNAIANISVSKFSDTVIATGEYIEVPTVTVSFGNEFRYDSTDNQYIYNLSTKNFTEGQYLITIKLNDGQSYSTKISLK